MWLIYCLSNVQEGGSRRSPRCDLALGGGVPPCLGGRRYPRRRRHVGDEKRALRHRSAPLEGPSRPPEKGRTSHGRRRGRARAMAAGEGEREPRPPERERESPSRGRRDLPPERESPSRRRRDLPRGGERETERERERKRTGEMGRRRAATGCLEEIRFGSFLFCPFTFFKL